METREPNLPRIPESGKRQIETADEALKRVKESTLIDLTAAARLPLEPSAQADEGAAEEDDLLDLSAVPNYARSVVKPQINIPYGGNVGDGSLRAAEEVAKASMARNLATPTPAALALHNDKADAKVVYGIPYIEQDPRYLNLEWPENNQFRANFATFLRAKGIAIPNGTKMIIDVEAIEHPKHGPCVKLSWDANCFVSISPRGSRSDETKTP